MLIPLIVEILAVRRITRLIVEDEITEPIRDEINGRFPGSKLAYLVSCPMCVSVWAAGLVVLTSRRCPGFARTMALSEATIALRKLLDG